MATVKMLNLKLEKNGMTMIITPALIISGNELLLVDCGNPGLVPLLEENMAREGFKLEDLTKVVITHHDHDHYGSLAELKRKLPQLKVVASEFDAPFIMGIKRSLRLQKAESDYDSLPEDKLSASREYQAYLKSIEPVHVDEIVRDGATLDEAGDVEIVATPGHMPGHISVYVKGVKTLVSGDALTAREGVLLMASSQYSFDLDEARKSARHLASYDIERIICYHGGSVEGDIKTALLEISKDV